MVYILLVSKIIGSKFGTLADFSYLCHIVNFSVSMKKGNGTIKYSYCLNENNELVHINSVTKENRYSHTYHCLECGHEMITKLGPEREKHFAHKTKTACDGESYLHKLAKRRILEKFMSAENFPLVFMRDVPCQDALQCPCCLDGYCMSKDVAISSDLKKYRGNLVYDTCQEEVTVEDFRPDLLLTCSKKPEREPVFIEVYKTNKSKESKVTSKYRIVETLKIKSEADIDDIISRGFIEGKNCKTYNFSPKLPSIKKNDVPIDRFVLFRSGAATVYRADDYEVLCGQRNQRVEPNSIRELNMRGGIDIWGDLVANNKLDAYQTGLVYLRKKGLQFKNCILCKYYKLNYTGDNYICILYKNLGLQSRKPKQSKAKDCPRYEDNPELMSHSLSELEKEVSEVPM